MKTTNIPRDLRWSYGEVSQPSSLKAVDDAVSAAVKKLMAEDHDRRVLEMLSTGIYGGAVTTSTADSPSFNLDSMVKEWRELEARFHRGAVTVVVDQSHEGDPLIHRHPTEGEFVEVCWCQAQELHQVCPLALRRVRSVDSAEFTPATPFDGPFFRILPMPPYDLPDEEVDL